MDMGTPISGNLQYRAMDLQLLWRCIFFLCFSTWLDSHPDPSGVERLVLLQPLSPQMHDADTSFFQPLQISHGDFTNGLTPRTFVHLMDILWCKAKDIWWYLSRLDIRFPPGIDQRELANRQVTIGYTNGCCFEVSSCCWSITTLWNSGQMACSPVDLIRLLDCNFCHVASPQDLLMIGFLGGSNRQGLQRRASSGLWRQCVPLGCLVPLKPREKR